MTETIEMPDVQPDAPVAAPGAVPGVATNPFRDRVAKVAGFLEAHRGRQGRRGLLAILRRVDADDCVPAAEPYWELVQNFSLPQSEEETWLRLLPLMARHPNDFSARPGRAFADAGVSPARLERWLRSEGPERWAGVRHLLARVGDDGVSWPELAQLLRDWTPTARRTIARDFFRHRHSLAKKGS